MTFDIKSQVIGSFRSAMDKRLDHDAAAITDAVKSSTALVKNNWRAQIRGAGLSSRLGNTVRSKTYPATGSSLHPAGEVFASKGTPQFILAELEQGAVINVARGRFLAIPTQNVPRGPRGTRLTPHTLEAITGYHLRYAQNKRGTKMLVADTVASKSKRGGIRPASRTRRGRTVTTLVFYILVPQVTIKKRLNLISEANRIGGELAQQIAERLGD
jgi:hypothetical protein